MDEIKFSFTEKKFSFTGPSETSGPSNTSFTGPSTRVLIRASHRPPYPMGSVFSWPCGAEVLPTQLQTGCDEGLGSQPQWGSGVLLHCPKVGKVDRVRAED